MDFETMLNKLDEGQYKCAADFLDDIDLIAENALSYNDDLNYETNKIICHRARGLQVSALFFFDCVYTFSRGEVGGRLEFLVFRANVPTMTGHDLGTQAILEMP